MRVGEHWDWGVVDHWDLGVRWTHGDSRLLLGVLDSESQRWIERVRDRTPEEIKPVQT